MHWNLRFVKFLFAATLPYGPCRGGSAAVECIPRFTVPTKAPGDATAYNGVGLHACFNYSGPHHVFVIGDWGGDGVPPVPADRRGLAFPDFARSFVKGVDDSAQQRVATQMKSKAVVSNPDYVLNTGNSFYWAGIKVKCGARPFGDIDTGQWTPVFEEMYRGPGLDGKPWLGVLGNHDYGGWTFTQGWDQMIGRTWSGPPVSSGRWIMPAQYWSASVRYLHFSVEYFFIDSNAFDAFDPHDKSEENICGLAHTPDGASCGSQGPNSVWDCPEWFQNLWAAQIAWIGERLSTSDANWQIVVTHFPPLWGKAGWRTLAMKHGIDLIISGHIHQQEVHYLDPANFLVPTAWLVSGGGGGITSEGVPNVTGADDQYGFMDLLLAKDKIVIEAISHGGQIRSITEVRPRQPAVSKHTAKHDMEHNQDDIRDKVIATALDVHGGLDTTNPAGPLGEDSLESRATTRAADGASLSTRTWQRSSLQLLTHWSNSPVQYLCTGVAIGLLVVLTLGGYLLHRFDWNLHTAIRALHTLLFQCSSKRCCSYTQMPLAAEDTKCSKPQSYEFMSVPLEPLDIRDEDPTFPDTTLGTGCGCWRSSRKKRWLPPSDQFSA